MNLIQESFQRLFPDTEFKYKPVLEYNRRLGNFNANIALRSHTLKVNMNLQWKDIDSEIKIGLIQYLLLKLFNARKQTQNLELYASFIKQIPLLTPKTKTDPLLEASFDRINQRFFHAQMEKPNLRWGQQSCRKLASYNLHNDTITVSTLFTDVGQEVLDYLMYHELLHKHFKFKQRNGRSRFHTHEFKEAEKLYPGQQHVEQELNNIIMKKRKKKTMFTRFF